LSGAVVTGQTTAPTAAPTAFPTRSPTTSPTAFPTKAPSTVPTAYPTKAPTVYPTALAHADDALQVASAYNTAVYNITEEANSTEVGEMKYRNVSAPITTAVPPLNVSAPNTTAVPLSTGCADSATWKEGLRGDVCAAYACGRPNQNFCGEDIDSTTGLLAEEACPVSCATGCGTTSTDCRA